MKRVILVLLALLLVVACAPKGLNLVYNAQSGSTIQIEPIYLKVKDLRTNSMLVSSEVMQKDLFTNVGDRLSLTARGIAGRTVQLRDVTVAEAFQEAFRTRLQGVGVGVLPDQSTTAGTLIIEVEKFQLGLGPNRTITADVNYTARFYKGAKQVYSTRITGTTQKFYLLGESTGEDALGEAFTSAVNGLDLGALVK